MEEDHDGDREGVGRREKVRVGDDEEDPREVVQVEEANVHQQE